MGLRSKKRIAFFLKSGLYRLCYSVYSSIRHTNLWQKSAKRSCIRYIGPKKFILIQTCDQIKFLLRKLKLLISNERCDVLLINPPYSRWEQLITFDGSPQSLIPKRHVAYRSGYTINIHLEAPLGLASLAAYLQKNNFNVKIIDMEVEHITYRMLCSLIKNLKPKVIGISGITRQANFAYRAGQLIKAKFPSTPLVYGGVHSSLFFKEPFEKGCADFVVRGEGEETMLQLCNALTKAKKAYSKIKGIAYKSNKQIKLTEERLLIKDVNCLPFPALDLLPIKKYYTNLHIKPFNRELAMSIMASRGCIYNCKYCSIPLIWQRKLHMISPKNIIQQIENIIQKYGLTYFHFYDDDFLSDTRFVKEFCSTIEENNIQIRWVIQGCVTSVIKNKTIIPQLKELGCVAIELGIESCDDSILRGLGKSQTVKDIIQADKIIRENGIMPIYLIMAFCPGETIDKVYNSAQLINKLFRGTPDDYIEGIHKYASFPFFHGLFFTPVPGSAICKEIDKRGVVLAKNWNHIFFTRVNFIPQEFLDDVPEKRMLLQRSDFLKIMKDYEPIFLYYFKNFRGLVFNKNLINGYRDYLNKIYERCDGENNVKDIINETVKEYPQTFFEQGALGIRFLAMFGLIKSKVNRPS